MTSVTLPSSSGPIHRVYSSVTEIPSSEPIFESSYPIKRCFNATLSDSCKKRRKQSRPNRIFAAESDSPSEGKPFAISHETESLKCPVCQLNINYPDYLQNHIATAHSTTEVKKEPQEEQQLHQFLNPSEPIRDFKYSRPELQMMNDLQTKDWMARSLNPVSSVFMHLPQYPQSESIQRQHIKIFNPDAYCDLCNKEFCNKYFLKTHKANKHGIYTDSSSESFSNTIPSYVRIPTSVPSELQIKTESQTTSNIINPTSDIFPNPFSNTLCRLSQLNKNTSEDKKINENQQCSNESSNGDNEKIPFDGQPNGESSSPKTIENESTSYKSDQDGLYYVPTSKISPGQINFTKEMEASCRLRKNGVMNPKAFCEICCKEYCNKYFLRTHKMKRHGIFIPDEKDIRLDIQNSSMWNQANVQTSPLNLIITEQSSSDRKIASPAEISCDICEIKFQNASLAQLHNISVHNKLHAKDTPETSEQSIGEIIKVSDNILDKNSTNDSINDDLKKLQTMILQLNELEVEKLPVTCTGCNKDFESRYFLHAHMITEHGLMLDEIADVERPIDYDSSSNNNTMCDLCGKDVQNIDQLKKHLTECHPNIESNIETVKDPDPDKMMGRVAISSLQISERRMSMSLTPTSSYCDICNKELCNKYFMKTHMQRMHGIEIENGAQIGGVICDICNKELCSKYFLRVHKHNTHGIVEYGTNILQPKKNEGENTSLPAETDSSLRPTDLADLSHRYFSHFTEVCKICSRRFRSTKWLKAHLLSDHGQAGTEKWAEMEQQMSQNLGQNSKPLVKTESCSPTLKIPNDCQDTSVSKIGLQNVLSLFNVDESGSKTYQCGMCSFTTPLLPLLFVHERSHSIRLNETERADFKCHVCGQTFQQSELFQNHMIRQHPLFPLPSNLNGTETKETTDIPDDDVKNGDSTSQEASKCGKLKKAKRKWRKIEFTTEVEQSLNDISKITQMPVTYALPKSSGEEQQHSKYFMQAFVMKEETAEQRVVPAVVFLPVLQKQPAPLSVTFTLTPA